MVAKFGEEKGTVNNGDEKGERERECCKEDK